MKTNSRGATLTEMMVAVAILSIGALGLLGAMGGIQKAVQVAKTTTLAATLAQEQMQILKQRVYYQILVTTAPAYDTNYAPNIAYDPSYFPPEPVLEGGVNYTRYTLVEAAEESGGVITTLPPGTPDTGMKLVTTTVIWNVGAEKKKAVLRTIVSNPDTVTANSIFNGTVRDASTLAPIPGAMVNMAENVGWRDETNASGVYQIELSPGSFTLGVVVPGYFPAHRSVSISALQTKTEDFDLVPMSSGSAVGQDLWVNPNVVISQVIVSTAQAEQSNFEAQIIELYNPTASTITVGSGSTPNQLLLKIASGCSGANYVTCSGSTYGIKLNYINDVIHPYGYYVIANTGTFTVNGASMTADAVYADDANTFCSAAPLATYWNLGSVPPVKKLAPTAHGATFFVTDSSGTILDAVGYDHSGIQSPFCEGNCLQVAAGGAAGEQYVRYPSTSAAFADFSSYGRAYDSGSNRVDFTTNTTVLYPVFGSSTTLSSSSVVSGRVPVGAIISATDGLSLTTQAYASGSPPTARFALTQVATGTWTMLVSSGAWSIQHDTVTIAATGSVFTLPSTMNFLNTPNTDGFISGRVTDVLGSPIASAVPVDSGGAGLTGYASTVNGRYMLRVSSGLVNVTANSGIGAVETYVSGSSVGVSVELGVVTSGVDFDLSQGGRISGFVTRDGVNALPGVAVVALDINGYAQDQQASGPDGYFTTLNIATGTYEVQLSLDSLESANPSSATVSVTAGGNVFAGTFTVTGALGTITGAVDVGGAPLRTGALIVVTTSTLAGSPPAPPALSSNTLSSSPYYAVSSKEDGTYSVDVRQSTSPAYRVYAYYVTYGGANPTVNSSVQTGVQVLSGQTVTGVDFSW